jgi:hypothetical protein
MAISKAGKEEQSILFDRYIAIKSRFPQHNFSEVDKLFELVQWHANNPNTPSFQTKAVLAKISTILGEIASPQTTYI